MKRGGMITKIHNIRGVGRFKNFECNQGIDLEKLTLIFSENGQGKSTLADILRSLSDGDESRMLGRKSVGATDQFIKFKTEDGTHCFHEGSWNGSLNNILVFDEVFINDNIYEGLSVRPEQRENLHPIIVGDVQVRGVQKEEELVASRKDSTKSQREVEERIKTAINNVVTSPEYRLSIEDFIALDRQEDIAARIKTQGVVVEQYKDSHLMHNESKFRSIDELVLPLSELRKLLNKKLSGIADDAKQALQNHVDGYSGNEMKPWLSRGTQYVRENDDICPFCGQSLEDSSLIEHYLAIFEKTYESFETEVSTFSTRELDFASWLTDVRSSNLYNQGRTFWTERIPDIEIPTIDVDLIERTLAQVKARIDELLTLKESTLFKTIPESPALMAALSSWTEVSKTVEKYRKDIGTINESIDNVRTDSKSGDLTEAERKRAGLKQSELRHSEDVARDCKLYVRIGGELKELARQLEDQRKKNSEAINNTFAKYGTSLDKYLGELSASFRIKDLVETRVGGVLRADYKIGLSVEKIALGKPDTNISQRSFRNVLSEGDKRTLAMAFFLSRIDQMNDLKDTIIVFDDPVTSMDNSRRDKTLLKIGHLAKQAQQVIVLSHRPEFLHSIWYRFCRHSVARLGSIQLTIQSAKNSSVLKIWNMEATVASRHAKRIRRVLDYYNDESDRDEDEISGALRPLLEYHYKIHYPELFEHFKVSTLGEFARKLDPNSTNPVVQALALADKGYLADLNIVHRETVHGQDPPPDPLSRTELKTDCSIVLKLLGRREIAPSPGH